LQESSEGPSEGHAPEPPPAAMAPFPAHMVAAAAGGGISAAQLAAVAAAVGFDTVGFDDNESHWSDDDSEAAADSDDVEGVFRVCDAGLEGFRHGDAFAFFISDDAVFNSLSGGDYDVFLDKDSLVSLGIARECGIVRADLDLDLNVNKKMDPKLFHAAALVLDAPLRHDCLFTSPWFDTCCKLLAMLIRFSQFRESLCQCKYVQAAALGRRYLLHCASERDASADDAARSVFRILQALVEDVPGFCVAEEMNEDDQPKAFRALNLASRHALAIASRSPALAEDEGEGSPTDAKANPPRGEAVQFLRSLARHLFMPWPDVDDADAFLEVLLENPPASCSPTLDADGDEEGYVTLDLAVAACLVEFVENAAFDKDDPDNEDDDDVCAFWLRRLCDAQHLLPLVHFVMATGAEASKFAFLVKHAGSCAQGKKIIVNCLRAYVPNVDIPSLKGLSAEKIYYKLAGVAETPATSAVAAALQESYERFFREDAAAKAARFIEAKARAAAHQIWLEEQKVVSERVAQELVALEEAEAALHEAKKNVKKSKKKGKHKPKAAAPPAAPETPQQDDSSDDDDYFLGLRGRRASLSQASKGVSALQTAPTSPEVADEWNTVESSRNDRKEKQSKKREEYEREMTDLARAAAKAEAVERKRVADLDAADRAIAASFDFKGFTSGDAKVDGLLAELGLHFLAPAFLEHEIDRDALKLLTVDDYAEIGVDRNIAEMLITGVSRLWAAGGPLQEDGEVPEHFVCPISFDLMRDPVVAADGASYEKQCIEEWLQDNDTSPLTNLPLAHKDLRPNHALKHLIMKRYSRGAASSSGAFSSWSAPSVEKTSRYAAVMRPHTGPGRGVPLVMAAGTPVRSGRIRVWKYQYGFIIPGDGGLDIFFHDKSTLEPGDPPFVPGDRVVYQMATGLHIDGKPPAAVNVKKA